MHLVAHRAGNELATIDAAAAVAHTIELDVHGFRRRLEVRHAKVIRPFAIHWERAGRVRDLDPPVLHVIIDAVPADVGLWLDVKGFTRSLARRVLDAAGDHRPLTMSCRSWWVLRPVTGRTDVDTFRSVANRLQLWMALRMRHPDGVVLHERFVDADCVARLRPRCHRIAAWAIETVERAVELEQLGVDAVIVDDLELIGALRRRLDNHNDDDTVS